MADVLPVVLEPYRREELSLREQHDESGEVARHVHAPQFVEEVERGDRRSRRLLKARGSEGNHLVGGIGCDVYDYALRCDVRDRGGKCRSAYGLDDQIEAALETVDDGVGTDRAELLAALLDVAHQRRDVGATETRQLDRVLTDPASRSRDEHALRELRPRQVERAQ